ncbi:DUF1045 domain-containing protein [Paracoccus aurantiacus]|uniref:DUF1045 domain-containing protein n=1 Tax=Paracoccus aurantiacus TaxID=2599412 RepID=A0A5C6S4U7_9RHOB|nr:DUF1045 domain-containing protein [Paracoccus aurantiacus]TXB69001.1 DUF1045 domain-containing protein [Paracoccus aurantiacus]
MFQYRRYAVYYTPPQGQFADFAARWLGWDAVAGREVAQPVLPGLDIAKITSAPRKYGFHATLKAPFRLAADRGSDALYAAVEKLAERLSPVTLDGLTLSRIGGFLALTPVGETAGLNELAAEVVKTLDPFRDALTAAEIARRNPDALSPRQRAYLDRWGYPYVFDEFRYHMTLTSSLAEAEQSAVMDQLTPRLSVVPRPFTLDALSLAGEAADGRFHVIERFAL